MNNNSEEKEDGKEGDCVLCNGMYFNYGNNPAPLSEVGRCCDLCNSDVISARIRAIKERNNK